MLPQTCSGHPAHLRRKARLWTLRSWDSRRQTRHSQYYYHVIFHCFNQISRLACLSMGLTSYKIHFSLKNTISWKTEKFLNTGVALSRSHDPLNTLSGETRLRLQTEEWCWQHNPGTLDTAQLVGHHLLKYMVTTRISGYKMFTLPSTDRVASSAPSMQSGQPSDTQSCGIHRPSHLSITSLE